jgi:hypothetical protein
MLDPLYIVLEKRACGEINESYFSLLGVVIINLSNKFLVTCGLLSHCSGLITLGCSGWMSGSFSVWI